MYRTVAAGFAALVACTSSVDGTYHMTVQQVRSFACAGRPPGWTNGGGGTTLVLELSGDRVVDTGSFSCTGEWSTDSNGSDGGHDLSCMIPNGGIDATGAPCTDMVPLTVRTSGDRLDPPGQLADGEIAMWLGSVPSDFYATGTR